MKVELERRPSQGQIPRGALEAKLHPKSLSQIQARELGFQMPMLGSHWLSSPPGSLQSQALMPSALWAKRCQKPRGQEKHTKPPGGSPRNCEGADAPELSAVGFAE